LATDKKNEAIASDLNLPLGTFNVTKTSLYRKLDIYNKPQSVFILMKEGLL
jgi:DNA-binding NarL/FixJ family response regulator